jgi:NADH-quinone oxidoreductase subunit L
MGGLRKYLPITYATMFIAALSAGGVPGFAGFFSKDEILWSTFASGSPVGMLVWILITAVAFFTPFYSFRMIFLAFHGKFRGTHHEEHHLHESPKVMTIPLMLLAAGALGAGWIGIPALLGGSAQFTHFLEPVVGHPELHGTHADEWGIMGLSTTIAVSGIIIAAIMYLIKTGVPLILARRFSFIYRTLFNKYYVDELYHFIIIKPALWIAYGFIERFTDAKIIEGIVNGVPRTIGKFSEILRKIQTGFVYHYAIIMAAGILFIAALFLL